MKRLMKLSVVCGAATALIALAANANGVLIENNTFRFPDVLGYQSNLTPDGWTRSGGDGGLQDSGIDGNQSYYDNRPIASEDTLSQTLSENAVVGRTYTLTYYVGAANIGSHDATARLLIGGSTVASQTHDDLSDVGLARKSITYTAGAGETGALGVKFAWSDVQGSTQAQLDLVVLDDYSGIHIPNGSFDSIDVDGSWENNLLPSFWDMAGSGSSGAPGLQNSGANDQMFYWNRPIGTISQTLQTTVPSLALGERATQYTLEYDLGAANVGNFDVLTELLIGGSSVASNTLTNLGYNSPITTYSFTFDADASYSGQALGVCFTFSDLQGSVQAQLDEVRLSSITLIPEPSTLVLLCSFVIAFLVGYACRRKSKSAPGQ